MRRAVISNLDAGNSSDQNFPAKDSGPIDIGDIVLDPRGTGTLGIGTRQLVAFQQARSRTPEWLEPASAPHHRCV
jgi:hypothetical protein